MSLAAQFNNLQPKTRRVVMVAGGDQHHLVRFLVPRKRSRSQIVEHASRGEARGYRRGSGTDNGCRAVRRKDGRDGEAAGRPGPAYRKAD
jgi:hypothetical protein